MVVPATDAEGRSLAEILQYSDLARA